MRIALVAPPFVRVPPEGYGGTELIVADLARVLSASGHQVTLFASGDSQIEGCTTRSLFPRPIWPVEPTAEWNHAVFAARILADEPFDVVHSHTPALVPLSRTFAAPVIHTLHHEALQNFIQLYRSRPEVRYACISARQAELMAEAFVRPPAVVHHGLDLERYPEGDGSAAALFIGRLDEVKAPHLALRAAREAGIELRIAGRPHDGDYFDRVLAPELARGGAEMIGEVGGEAKTRELGAAKVVLFSSTWEEPFGLAVVESMLCGTPVVALRRGAVPELVDEGVTGISVETPEEMAPAIRAALKLDRRVVRERARERFGVRNMARSYLNLYLECLEWRAPEPEALRG